MSLSARLGNRFRRGKKKVCSYSRKSSQRSTHIAALFFSSIPILKTKIVKKSSKFGIEIYAATSFFRRGGGTSRKCISVHPYLFSDKKKEIFVCINFFYYFNAFRNVSTHYKTSMEVGFKIILVGKFNTR